MKIKGRLVLLLTGILLLGVEIGLLLLHWDKVYTLLVAFNKLLLVLAMVVLNSILSLCHEFGHTVFANPIYIKCQKRGIHMHFCIPFFATEYEMCSDVPQSEKLFFYLGGSVVDACIGGGAGFTYLLTRVDLFLLIVMLEVLRILTNCIPVVQNDGYKCLQSKQ